MSIQPDKIIVRGAREHNLKNVNVEIPRNTLTVLTGLSGSGKSTLAFDTIYAEGQRRYVESLSAYARQFLGVMNKPDCDSIEGLSPAISIDQKGVSKNPRSTVGTITEIYDYMRLLWARVGVPHCPICNREIRSTPIDDIIALLMKKEASKLQILSPIAREKKGAYEKTFEDMQKAGYARVRVDGELFELGAEIKLDKNLKHTIEVVIDRVVVHPDERTRVYDAVRTALGLSKGYVTAIQDGQERLFSTQNACIEHGISLGELQPRFFSFNSPFGACAECDGLGVKLEFDEARIIPDEEKSIEEGAIAPWGGMQRSWRIQSLQAVGKKFGFKTTTPWKDLSKDAKKIILFGTHEKIAYKYESRSSDSAYNYSGEFEGVMPNLERSYKQTESESRKEDLQSLMRERQCPQCRGKRLKPEMLAVTIGDQSIIATTDHNVDEALRFFYELKLDEMEKQIATPILKEIKSRLEFLHNVGLDYLTLSRKAATLSGGEAQRIRLATQIGSQLTGVLYVLDEPSIGLHQRDNQKLLDTLKRLRDLGNTLLVVEHDEDTMRQADYLIDIGPGAGVHGGEIVASGTPAQVMKSKESITAAYLRGDKSIPVPKMRRRLSGTAIIVKGAKENNLKNVDASFPLGALTLVTGVSGSGKSTLVTEILWKTLHNELMGGREDPGLHDAILGVDKLDKVIAIDQNPIGRTPRSNPATYIGAFTAIRELFARTPAAQERGMDAGTFSFNVARGRCEACEGDGVLKIEMQFLADVFVPCETCKGKRYDNETLQVTYKGKNIADVLDMTIEEAIPFFEKIPSIHNKLQTIFDVGLGYVKLGQAATTLSGGEAQRVKLAAELSKRATGKTVYILDEPTTGLHFHDVAKLLEVLGRLVDKGNTVIVIEHNLDVIKTADWIIDLGPEGGTGGGTIVGTGTPEAIANNPKSYTGKYLKEALKGQRA